MAAMTDSELIAEVEALRQARQDARGFRRTDRGRRHRAGRAVPAALALGAHPAA